MEAQLHQNAMFTSGHCPTVILAGFHQFCCVCKLEEEFQATFCKDRHCKDAFKSCITKGMYGMQHMVACSHNDYSLHAHSVHIESQIYLQFASIEQTVALKLHIMRKQLVCDFLIQNLNINA